MDNLGQESPYSNTVGSHGYIIENADGTITSIDAPESAVLVQIFPNPFNPQTTISLELPQMSRVELAVYNIQGRLVETLFEGNKSPGVHQFTWYAGNLPSGIYFYQLETDLGNETGKMILMK